MHIFGKHSDFMIFNWGLPFGLRGRETKQRTLTISDEILVRNKLDQIHLFPQLPITFTNF